MFFKLFRAPKLDGLSFLDWTNRIVITLRDSKAEVEASKSEDTFDNVLKVFRVKAYDLLRSFNGIPLQVNEHGIFSLNKFTLEEVYILKFNTYNKVAGLPVSQDLSRISAYNHVSGLMLESYKHRLGKLHSTQQRLEHELGQVLDSVNNVNNHLLSLSIKSKTRSEINEYKEKNQFTDSEGVIHKLAVREGRLTLKPVKKKSKKKKKTTPKAKVEKDNTKGT
jgi:hypothetical protein